MTTFAEIVSNARLLADMTNAEFDYSLANDDRGTDSALNAISSAAYLLANAGLPEIDLVATNEDLHRREANAKEVMDTVRPELDAMIAAAKAKSYTGWSDAARGQGRRIKYATD